MIKGNLFGKSLKQFFIILLISCFILLGSSFVNACTPRTSVGEGVYINGGIHPVGGLFTSSSNNAFDNGVFTLGNFKSSNLGVEKKLFAYDDFDFWFWDSNGLPYFYGTDANVEYFYQGNPNGYYYCEEIDGNTPTTLTNCSYNSIGTGSALLFRTFMSSVKFGDYYAYLLERYYRESNYMSLCISNSFLGHTLCFTNDVSMGCSGINSKGYSNLTYNSVPDSILFDSPASNNSGGGSSDSGNEVNKTDRTIEYFESQGFRREMCFVGTNDLTTLYGSGTDSFQVGTGKTIFDLFESEYVYIEDTDYGYQAVANWLNSRLTNYYQWFNFGELSSIKANYSSVDELISIYYYGQDERATFPFLNNPFAIYFMASNISDYVQMKSIADFEGEDVVDYCNLKVNGGTFDDLISPSTENAINRISNNTNNVGGFENNDDSNDGNVGTGVIGGTGENSYTGTWQSLQFTGKVTFKSFFDNAVESMREASSNMQNPFSGVLPNYIIFGLLLFALFKVIRH